MKTYFITILLLLTFLNSCEETHEQVKVKSAPEATANEADDIVISTSIDKDGRKLELFFNNTKGIVTLNFDGETIQLVQQRAASGIWYKNEIYATTCILGGTLFFLLQRVEVPQMTIEIICLITVVVFRLLAVKYDWQLPLLWRMEKPLP